MKYLKKPEHIFLSPVVMNAYVNLYILEHVVLFGVDYAAYTCVLQTLYSLYSAKLYLSDVS